MNYHLDKKIKRHKYLKFVILALVIAALLYFNSSIFHGFSYMTSGVFRPILSSSNSIGEKLKNLSSYFFSKSSLLKENTDLKTKIANDEADRANYHAILSENISLKEVLGRKNEQINMVLSAILAKPNQSLYDTLVIDAGESQGVKVGARVFAFGSIPIGRVGEVYANSSKIILLSSSGERTQVVVMGKPEVVPVDGSVITTSESNIFLEIVGRGGGNFEMIMPRDAKLVKGDQVILPGINPYVVGVVETIISDPRDSFQKALLTTPINIQSLKFVEVEISN